MLHTKKKKKLQGEGRRGDFVIYANPKTAGWVSHKLENNYIPKPLQQKREFQTPCKVIQSGNLAWGRGDPRAFSIEVQQGLSAGVP